MYKSNNQIRTRNLQGEDFWDAVQSQFENINFTNVIGTMDAVLCDRNLSNCLIPYLSKPIYLKNDLTVITRFDAMSKTAKFNFVSLICYLKDIINEIPEFILNNNFYLRTYESFTKKNNNNKQRFK